MTSAPTPSGESTRRRRSIIGLLAGAVVVVVGLCILAIPLLSVPGDARAGSRDLTRAVSALQRGDLATARTSLANARQHVDAAQDDMHSLGARVWGFIPFLGTPVDDASHLVQALDDVTAVAETGMRLYPFVSGPDATLFRDQQMDRATLDDVIEGVRTAGVHLSSAQAELSEVRGTTPLVGGAISRERDEAAERVDPLADGSASIEPLLDDLPGAFGFGTPRRYLVALLNPAELRYSGGAALAFDSMSWEEGRLEVGQAFSLVDDQRLRTDITWPRVAGNRFHGTDTRVSNATFAPSWSVSGEELLRAWRTATGERYDAVLALDVVAMSKLLAVTGPATVPGLGQVSAANLVDLLVGNYDAYYPDASAQERTSAPVVVGSLQSQLFAGGDYVAKGRALKRAAEGRHLALYFRDPGLQGASSALGLDGDLEDASGDYLGVFTQSLVGSKVDYYQRRTVSLDVTLDESGRATNELVVDLHNDTPPFVAAPLPDPRSGYFTRWSTLAVGVFLPQTVEVGDFTLGGQPWEGKVRTFYDHSYLSQGTVIPPTQTTRLQASYQVPDAASVGDLGELTYRLAIDPQGTVSPASVDVTLHLPTGYQLASAPDGWSQSSDTVVFRTDTLTASDWTITLVPTG